MLTPTKHEKLNKNLLVLGADIISFLRKNRLDIESLFNKLKNKREVDLELFYNTVTFLWMTDVVKKEGYFISLNR